MQFNNNIKIQQNLCKFFSENLALKVFYEKQRQGNSFVWPKCKPSVRFEIKQIASRNNIPTWLMVHPSYIVKEIIIYFQHYTACIQINRCISGAVCKVIHLIFLILYSLINNYIHKFLIIDRHIHLFINYNVCNY